jgi:hypothetical protein
MATSIFALKPGDEFDNDTSTAGLWLLVTPSTLSGGSIELSLMFDIRSSVTDAASLDGVSKPSDGISA